MAVSLSPRQAPLPEKIVALVNEARWLLVAAAGFYLGLALWGFDHADPGWSHAAFADRIANPGGRFGAWLADLMLYLFGFSAWWWVVFLLFVVAWGYRRLQGWLAGDRRPFLIAAAGFAVLLASSVGIEAMRFWSVKSVLPLAPGGLLGAEIGRWTTRVLGYNGGTLILLALFAAGLSLLTGVSWIAFAEKVGHLLEVSWLGSLRLWRTWQDRRIGRAVAE